MTFFTATGTASSSLIYHLCVAGGVYGDDVNGSSPALCRRGREHAADGGFSSPVFPGPGRRTPNLINSVLSTRSDIPDGPSALISTGTAAPKAAPSGDHPPGLTGNAIYTLSFWYLQHQRRPLTSPVRLRYPWQRSIRLAPPPPSSPLNTPAANKGGDLH